MPKRKSNKEKKSEKPPLRLEWIDAETLKGNPRNWRKHPPEQMAALQALINDVGWAGALLYNERTGRLVDGHARKLVARGPVPVLVGDWTEEQEEKILATLDPIAYMADASQKELAELVERVKDYGVDENVGAFLDQIVAESIAIKEEINRRSQQDTAELLGDISDGAFVDAEFGSDSEDSPTRVRVEELEPEPDSNSVKVTVSRKTFFESRTKNFELPVLPDSAFDTRSFGEFELWLGQEEPSKDKQLIVCYDMGSFTRREANRAILSLSPLDWGTLDSIFLHPISYLKRMLVYNWQGLIEPDSGVFPGVPTALLVSRIYMARWVACAVHQTKPDLPIIPNMHVAYLPTNVGEELQRDILYPIRSAPVLAACFYRGSGFIPVNDQEEIWRKWFLDSLNKLSSLHRLKERTVLVFNTNKMEKPDLLASSAKKEGARIILL